MSTITWSTTRPADLAAARIRHPARLRPTHTHTHASIWVTVHSSIDWIWHECGAELYALIRHVDVADGSDDICCLQDSHAPVLKPRPFPTLRSLKKQTHTHVHKKTRSKKEIKTGVF